MYSRLFILLLTQFFVFSTSAQFQFEYNPSIPVKVGADTLQHPWSGGLNYCQISGFDFDFDGDQDLFIFDRSSNNIRVYTQEGSGVNKHYEFQYDAKNQFPSDLRYRSALVDYDGDDRADLFTYGTGGIAVYRNVGDATNGLQWELASNLLYTQYPSIYNNLYVSSSDIPAIIDVDFDGDIDILTFDQSGQHIEYHQNQSIELYGTADSLVFIQMNQCWGKFSEDLNTNSVVLNDPNYPCEGGDIGMPKSGFHAGSTVVALDYDNSGVLDLILGDVAYPNLTLLINGGTAPNTDSPMISADNSFPSNTTPAEMQLFPAPFFVDVDFDGVKDLLVCANAKNVSQNVNSVLFYKNLGSNTMSNFVYVQNDFLQDEQIEHGRGSIPVFTDINEDGLEDLIVANMYRYKPILDKESTLAYYRNTGTATDPVYTFIDDNYLNLPVLGFGIRSVPTFGDVDDDGDKDMFLGIENGTLVYFENQSTGSGSIFTTGVQNYQDDQGQLITVDGYCFPQLFDLDNDGLLDLALGTKSGEIAYYRNIGSASSPSFSLYNATVGNVDVSSDIPDGYAAPHFIRYNDTTYLFVGDYDGRLHHFDDIDENLALSSSFHLVSSNFLGIGTEAFSAYCVTDANNNGRLELYAGQDLGGIYRFEHNPNSSISLNDLEWQSTVAIYPNPTNGAITVSTGDQLSEKIHVIDVYGKILKSIDVELSKEEIDLTHLPAGVYFLTVEFSNGQSITKKIVKH